MEWESGIELPGNGHPGPVSKSSGACDSGSDRGALFGARQAIQLLLGKPRDTAASTSDRANSRTPPQPRTACGLERLHPCISCRERAEARLEMGGVKPGGHCASAASTHTVLRRGS